MTSAGGRRLERIVLCAAAVALLATAAWMRTARGPAWLAFNFDPTYAYLLNSLTILKGYPPFLIHHPGMPRGRAARVCGVVARSARECR